MAVAAGQYPTEVSPLTLALSPEEDVAKGSSLRDAGTHRHFRWLQAIENGGIGKSHFSDSKS